MAITYGMSVKEFWEDNPDLFWAYRFSYYEKLYTQQDLDNQNAWLQGVYIYEAVSVAICNAFSKTKAKYSEQPYDIHKNEKTDENIEKQRNKLVEQLKGRVNQVQTLKGKTGSTTKDSKR